MALGTNGTIDPDWNTQAQCLGHPHPEWWHPEQISEEEAAIWRSNGFNIQATEGDNHGTRAKEVCKLCSVKVECVTFCVSANRTTEIQGIWGGLGGDTLRTIRRAWKTASTKNTGKAWDTYRRIAELETGSTPPTVFKADGSPADSKPWQPRGVCDRCGDDVKAGAHPTDRNGPGAVCGHPVTYARGCRCARCRFAMSTRNDDLSLKPATQKELQPA